MVSYGTGMQPKSVSCPHTIHPVWCTLVGAGSLWPQSQRVKIFDMIANSESKGRELFSELSTFIHGIDHYSCFCPLHGPLLNYSLGGEEDSVLSLSLSLSLSLELHNLWEQSQVGNANWFRKKMEKVDLERFEKS